jgi:hypothetical protein
MQFFNDLLRCLGPAAKPARNFAGFTAQSAPRGAVATGNCFKSAREAGNEV